MKEFRWLSKQVVLALQGTSIDLFGGSAGLRDEGSLDSALARPINHLSYGSTTIFELAANYSYGLARNHPFVDGNKRIAFLTGAVFLELNGQLLSASEMEVVVTITAVAAGHMTEAELAAWFRRNSDKAT
jgi:death-on-curing protein